MPTAQAMTIQGIQVPAAVVDPKAFFANVRRQRFTQNSKGSIAGFGESNQFSLVQSGIIGAVDIRVTGTITVTPGSGTVSTTNRWPFGLLKRGKLSANNMSNLINAGGWSLRAREFARTPGLTDRGISQSVNGSTVTEGTLSMGEDSWGVGSGVSDIASGTYDVQFSLRMPVAFDLELLGGALFAQTSATDLAFELAWANQSDLFVLTGNAAVSQNLSYFTDGVVFNIPRGPGGEIVVPDLSVFHTFVESNSTNLAEVQNEILLAGQGVGKQLLAVFWRWYNGSSNTDDTFVPVNDTNFGQLAWGYGGNEIPESYASGGVLAAENERNYGSDFGAAGYGVFDWASHWIFRDSIDMGSATQLRLFITPSIAGVNGNTFEYAQEIIVPGTAAGSVGSASAA